MVAAAAASPPRASTPTFIATLVMLSIYEREKCNLHDHVCADALWLQRASELGGAIVEASRRRVAVDLFSHCTHAREAETARGVLVRVHSEVPSELRATQARVPWSYNRKTGKFKGRRMLLGVTLLKWVAVSLVDAEYALVFDLDTNPLPSFLSVDAEKRRAVGREWVRALGRMRERSAHFAACPDGDSPINAGFMAVRPDLRTYREGVALLGRADEAFNWTHGWELLGPPQAVVPRSDPLWTSAPSVEKAARFLLNHSAWDFVGNAVDQGFFFHMYRVRRAWPYGLDFRHLSPSTAEHSVYRLGHEKGKPWRSAWLERARSHACAWPRNTPGVASAGLTALITHARNLNFYADALEALGRLDDAAVAAAGLRRACVATWGDAHSCLRSWIYSGADVIGRQRAAAALRPRQQPAAGTVRMAGLAGGRRLMRAQLDPIAVVEYHTPGVPDVVSTAFQCSPFRRAPATRRGQLHIGGPPT